MPTYSENIDRLRSSSRANVSRQLAQNIETANREGQTAIQQANQIAKSLSQFSKTLHQSALYQKAEDLKKGKQIAREHRQADADKLELLGTEASLVRDRDDTRFKEIQNEIIKIGGERHTLMR